MRIKLRAFYHSSVFSYILLGILLILAVTVVAVAANENLQTSNNLSKINLLESQVTSYSGELKSLKGQDPYKINQDLKKELAFINRDYKLAVTEYQLLDDLKQQNPKLDKKYDQDLALALSQLSDKNYASAEATLASLDKNLQAESAKIAPAQGSANNTPASVSNTPPNAGYNLQSVQTDSGTFSVSIIAADLRSTKVIVDTASDSDCANNCPVLPLADYVSRNGAFAGINGSFFCPADYPSCAGKINSFDTLLLNKNKHYFNSDNNVYSTVPAAIFGPGWARFVGRTLEWGRDTSVDAVIANYPMYIQGGNNNFGGNGDPKIDNKGTRTFLADKGSMVYIGVIYNSSGADAAKVLKVLGMDNAIGLDQGGSTALWYGGYKAGPGRNLPDAVLFIKK